MIHVLRIGDKERPLTIDEIRAELSLRFERLTMQMKMEKYWKKMYF
jgi:hypothetical protein